MNGKRFIEPRDAATVILMRPAVDAFEVLMVKRHPGNAFVPDRYVFPGGAVDDADRSPDMEPLCSGLDAPGAHRILADMPSRSAALAAWVAGIRETFEETGILLACDRNGTVVSYSGDNGRAASAADRTLLREGRLSFQGLLERDGLLIAADHLRYFAHWITPVASPIRYNVRFFAAEMPPGQEALHDGRELTDSVWISPAEALDLCDRKQFNMVLPTIMTLRDLNRFRTVADVLASTVNKQVRSILTELKFINGDYIEVMPDEDLHDPEIRRAEREAGVGR